MKKIIVAILTLILATPGISAQTQTAASPEEKVKAVMARIPAEAKLSVEQHDKIYALFIQFRADLDKLKKDDSGNKNPETKAKIKELHAVVDKKVQAMLTPEQYSLVKEALKK